MTNLELYAEIVRIHALLDQIWWLLAIGAGMLLVLNVWQVVYWFYYNGWLTESLIQRKRPNGAPSSMQ